ncbi:MAG: amidohydrolase family protein, partial [Firmicutes bacterium]|nr:amidohydrolase family protein [Bacillota bacterium]
VEASYLEDNLTVELIADGIHLPPELLRLIVKCKSSDSICLVTDSMRGACLGDYTGPAQMGSLNHGYEVLIENGVAFLKDHTAFAGSICTSNRCVRTMYQDAGVPLHTAVAMMSLHPARVLQLDHRKGSIEVGKDADICIFNEDIDVSHVIVKGKITKGESI